MSGTLQYATWTSEIEIGFYTALAKLKIDHDKLDSSARRVLGLYEVRPRDEPARSTSMQIRTNALTSDEVPSGLCRAEGMIRNFNTVEEFKEYDRTAHMELAGRTMWDAINDATIYSCPSLLSSFSAIFFANLKKYHFNYHFAYPALHSDPQWKQVPGSTPGKLSAEETTDLVDKYQTWRYSVDSRQHGFFLAKKLPYTQTSSGDEEKSIWNVASLSAFDQGFFNDTPAQHQYICFVDPSTYPTNPGWMLRNLLVLVRQRFQLSRVQILCYRDTHVRREHPTSIILNLQCDSQATSIQPATQFPKVTGWERNENAKVGIRTVDLAAYLDPTRLADQAVDLNLKLIKWRIAPSIDLDIVKHTSCLLLGAGTLGSYVSRNLMGWGVRKITFVDNAKVSYSNPVRQPLYNFSDCLDGGAKKAERAAEALKHIYPGIDARGITMSVPMAGHPITNEAATKADYEQLYELIQSHDVVFLLMDTRESRWLPTVMAKSMGKTVINAALGFDTYMVMRHGVRPARKRQRTSSSRSHLPISSHSPLRTRSTTSDDSSALETTSSPSDFPDELGCYFCSDVVAPADSLKSATLDQQCTVTRPGVAPIASALAVELLVSILQSPLKGAAPAPAGTGVRDEDDTHPLGSVPHQLRGFLSNWSTLTVRGKAYDCCSACSPAIVGAYERDGWGFVRRAISEQGYVEEVSGLAEVQRRAEEAADDVDWEEDSEVGDIDAEGELL
ncbi:E1-like protein-activating enzyme Gsa7p/Apg7p [Myriangium duriaei CBS 260.36]|uniref:Ubiquitin-like modifier-activating enzyme ATG7 n=1 Tax=Myriangium duriaei CBS 260.36 TaxID=1168546 RepID=A0A9P4J9U6_9PEZI|nr:E1-like protein-activating enzyme Gsa7p/Apg7p [Myriangium duriaei CBS 260.36]